MTHVHWREICGLLILALLLVPLCGCPSDDDDSGDDDDSQADDDSADDDTDGCQETAGGEFPAEAVEMSHEPDDGTETLLDHIFSISEYTGMGEELTWEATRFDLTAPATVHGARIMWGNLVGDEVRPVTLGAYGDFGSNGFDFDRWEPLWTGDRCLGPEDEATWVDYVFDPPLEVDLPGLFYIASYFEPEDSPLVMFDKTRLDCADYADCHSAFNLPEVDDGSLYNGTSSPWWYNYSIRLMVEYHDTIPTEDKWFQEDEGLSASSRVAWGDYNHDGHDDLMTNGPTLYRNNGDGSFTDVTTDAGLDVVLNSSGGGVWGDYDNDGCLDFFGQGTSYTIYDLLLRNNCDGTFTDVTLDSGIHDFQESTDCNGDGLEEQSPTEGAAWVDLDSDGLLDLYMANYECGGIYVNYIDRVWHNEGDGTFAEWGNEHGFTTSRQAGRGVSPIDADRDGDVDIFVSNYRLDINFFYENVDGSDFDSVATEWGLAGESYGSGMNQSWGHTIGSAWIDLENDGDWDLIQSNLAHPRYYHFSNKTMVLRNDGNQLFEDTAADAGIYYRETHSNPTVQDFDNDGDSDLFISCIYDGRFSELYLNDGDGQFTQVNYESGAVIHNGWGSAASDFDNDGDSDLLAYSLFRNDTAAAGNHWLQVRAIGGVNANWAAVGAVVEVEAGGVTRMNHVSGGSGTGCQDTMYLQFGLGGTDQVDEIRVTYPGGTTVSVDGPIAADQRVWVYEDGSFTTGWAP